MMRLAGHPYEARPTRGRARRPALSCSAGCLAGELDRPAFTQVVSKELA